MSIMIIMSIIIIIIIIIMSIIIIIPSSEGHLFCKFCLQRYVEQQLFGYGESL
jgi:hypothetical protein